MLGRPVAHQEPERVLRLTSTTTSATSLPFAFPELDAVRAHLGPSDALAAVALTPALLRVGDATSQDLIDVSVGAIHDVLGVRALRGRLLAANDDLPGRPRVLVVSEQYWRTRLFGADDVIGRQVMVNGLDYTVVGVAPTVPSLGFFGVSAAGWVPASGADSLLNPGWRTNPDDRAFIALIKLHQATPAALASLESALGRATGELAERLPDRWRERRLEAAEGLLVTGSLRGTSIVIASLLSAMAALLLVVAATNVGGLVFAQAAARRRATAIKAALGARPGTLVVGTLIEGLVLGVLAGVVALALYLWFAGLAQRIDLPLEDFVANVNN
jgi:hypothetical protein